MARWKLTIEYDGTGTVGWQRQDVGVSIQGLVESAIHAFCGEDVTLTVAGRTDSGVHALGQVAHVDIQRPTNPFELRNAVNAHLGFGSVSIVKAEAVPQDFHARFSALRRHYVYRILNRSSPPTWQKNFVWQARHPLNLEAMGEAADLLLGTHDFTTFRDTDGQAQSPIRTIEHIQIFRALDIHKPDVPFALHPDEILLYIAAPSFLHHMVRNIVGSLVLVGREKWTVADFANALKAKDRRAGGATAPAKGLFFVKVDYPE